MVTSPTRKASFYRPLYQPALETGGPIEEISVESPIKQVRLPEPAVYYNYDEATVGLYFYDFIDYCYRGSPLDLL